jgi:hypothetical protein
LCCGLCAARAGSFAMAGTGVFSRLRFDQEQALRPVRHHQVHFKSLLIVADL